MRQDAVMEQVFDLVNIVLRRDRETRKRNLRIRGYKVIPLATQAGLLEFVENTTPLQIWLQAAHPRYVLSYRQYTNASPDIFITGTDQRTYSTTPVRK